jgi:hypothetical protein
MIRLHSLAVAALLAAVIVIPREQPPQALEAATDAASGDTIDAWRFNVGERTEFSVTWGVARVGSASLTVEAVDTISGIPAYRTSLEMNGGPPFYRLEDRQVSWIRPAPFGSIRFDQILRQGSYRRDRRYIMDVEAGTYARYDEDDGSFTRHEDEFDVPIPDGALDEVSFFFFLRLSPLEVGERYEYDRFFKDDGNPVIIEVLRRERVRVPAGRFETLVLRPTLNAGGLFSEGSEAEIYVTDDDRRIPVRMKVKAPMGTLNLYLTKLEPGVSEAGIELPSG